MDDLLEYIAKNIVKNSDKVEVKEVPVDEKNIDLELRVDQEDLGRVIGRHGKVAQNIRTVLKAISLKKGVFYNLKIIEND